MLCRRASLGNHLVVIGPEGPGDDPLVAFRNRDLEHEAELDVEHCSLFALIGRGGHEPEVEMGFGDRWRGQREVCELPVGVAARQARCQRVEEVEGVE